jgi:hypothetical protein
VDDAVARETDPNAAKVSDGLFSAAPVDEQRRHRQLQAFHSAVRAPIEPLLQGGLG